MLETGHCFLSHPSHDVRKEEGRTILTGEDRFFPDRVHYILEQYAEVCRVLKPVLEKCLKQH